jgi:hypothetical protein
LAVTKSSPRSTGSRSPHEVERNQKVDDEATAIARTLSTISSTSVEVAADAELPVRPPQARGQKVSSASSNKIEGDWDCYWNDDGFDPVLRTIIRKYLGLYWHLGRAPRAIRAEDYDGESRVPINSYADFLRNDGWRTRALELMNSWPKAVTFRHDDLMSKSRDSDDGTRWHIRRFRDTYERLITPRNLGKYLDISHCLLLPANLPVSWEAFVRSDVQYLNQYANHTRKNGMSNSRRDWKWFMESMSYLVRHQILPSSVIMDPSIPIFPKNKMGWTAFGDDDQFGELLATIDRQEPHRIWYCTRDQDHPFWTELVVQYPQFSPASMHDL